MCTWCSANSLYGPCLFVTILFVELMLCYVRMSALKCFLFILYILFVYVATLIKISI